MVHDLFGLTGASPIGFLAALGMLRVLSSDRGLDVRLWWRNGHAVIEGLDPSEAVEEIMANMADRGTAPEFNWSDSPRKVDPEAYREVCGQMMDDPRGLAFMAGWASDAVVRKQGISVTRMDMTSGQQKLLRDLRQLAKTIETEHISSALMGGPYGHQPSFGLDPVAVRFHAHEHKAPTKSPPPGKPGLVWLAFESIPLHPVVPISPYRAQTTGWRINPEPAYVWPIWDAMLTLEEIRLLRCLPIDRLKERPGVSEI
ncbi:MAG: hypothetical protein K9M96_06400 [Deltaproteobacteria bacterium]|nr:hypothetical protein [Deltaproteobacteria bacterium]